MLQRLSKMPRKRSFSEYLSNNIHNKSTKKELCLFGKFLVLPLELKFLVMCYLSVKDMINLFSTCTQMKLLENNLSISELIVKILYKEEFASSAKLIRNQNVDLVQLFGKHHINALLNTEIHFFAGYSTSTSTNSHNPMSMFQNWHHKISIERSDDCEMINQMQKCHIGQDYTRVYLFSIGPFTSVKKSMKIRWLAKNRFLWELKWQGRVNSLCCKYQWWPWTLPTCKGEMRFKVFVEYGVLMLCFSMANKITYTWPSIKNRNGQHSYVCSRFLNYLLPWYAENEELFKNRFLYDSILYSNLEID